MPSERDLVHVARMHSPLRYIMKVPSGAADDAALPLVICGCLKIAYDFALLYSFRHIKPPEERT